MLSVEDEQTFTDKYVTEGIQCLSCASHATSWSINIHRIAVLKWSLQFSLDCFFFFFCFVFLSKANQNTISWNVLLSSKCNDFACIVYRVPKKGNVRVITKTRLFKYIETFTTKKGNFSDKKFWYFPYSCSKHRSWVPVRTAPSRRF